MTTAKPSRLTHGDVGAWVLKGNPSDTWDYFAALEDKGRPPGSVRPGGWTLGTTYRNQLIGPHDLFVLWITGPRNSGIYEIGEITKIPGTLTTIDDEYLIDQERRGQLVPHVDTKSVLLTHHVPRTTLLSDQVLCHCEQIRMPRISNPTFLTQEQTAALAAYIPDRDLRRGGWSRFIRGTNKGGRSGR